ncbi:hematopoietic lineage cell-specific protein-like isoform X2 [Rhinatrema bivittatum]|uniref:hematopoietic lineage cell-specific protein-like isoform X2 n=1 Tax=Rhinatrema bivittatum TaxID=194408 RepID=UPI00112B2423|nr:hematopoietic lineage cell-specific protein-like isoform X2 [Rhinatrema bivittatum]
MWKSVVGHNVSVKEATQGDDWDTDPDFVNDISEKEQRWGAKTIEGSGRAEHFNIHQLRDRVHQEHAAIKKKELSEGPKASYGYGGKFGTERDRMDKSALGHDYTAEVEKHSSQTDAAKGFGGKYGVQKDRADKSAVGFEYKGEVEKHASQTDYSKGFGGRYGVEKDKVDKAALGFDYKGTTEKHESQKDYAKGFGGKFGVQKDRQDKAAHSWDYQEEVKPHESQTDYAKGFGGRFGVQQENMDKSAVGFNQMEGPTTSYEKTRPVEAASSGASSLKARFENIAKSSEEENRKRAEEERMRRQAREKREREEALKRQQQEKEKEEEKGPELLPDVPAPRPRRIDREEPPVPEIKSTIQEKAEYEEPPDLPPRTPDLDKEYEDVPIAPSKELPIHEEDDDLDGDYERMIEVPAKEEEHIYDDDPGGDYEEIPDSRNLTCRSSDSVPQLESNVYDNGGVSAVALYDYQGEGDDEISFDPKDLITNIEMVDEGWWRGCCNGKVGLFPANYVQLTE